MTGIFKYQVPNRTIHTNQHQDKVNNSHGHSQIIKNNAAINLNDFSAFLINLIQMLIQLIGRPNNNVTTLAVGEEDGGMPPTHGHNGSTVTTLAIGEEDGGINPPPAVGTTEAMGEEDGGMVTTQALGEEDGGTITTYAIGEEDGGMATTLAVGEEDGGIATTLAVGEEDGSWKG
ncbi:MAG: hypothetical protein WAQ53_01170 [Thiofilum sp.]|uniref:hypothetical protein n=1 Tax=Thiofilum sp. TaxID=2212733 RepID=UPI0025EB6654|nr:hypothetical protein [Thiofilum sp.]MBK8455507.1 hypothetical protein [Thiofilum sp.]